jgi:hypothetical protein
MPEEITPTPATPEPPAAPDDFNDYEAWRKNPEAVPEAAPSPAPAAAKAETEPAPGSESGEPSAEDEEEESEKPGEPGRKRKSGFQRRIDKLTTEKRELAERVAALERLAAPAAGAEPAKPGAPVPKGDEKLTAETFENYDEFVDAVVDLKIAQKEKAIAAEAAKRATEAERQKAVDAWAARAAETRKQVPDYDDVMAEADDVIISDAMQQTILEADRGPEVAYWLAQNREEAERIAKLPALAAARAIGRIEAGLPQLKTDGSPGPKRTTSAPRPVTPVTGGKTTAVASIHDEETAADYNAWETARKADLKRKAAAG